MKLWSYGVKPNAWLQSGWQSLSTCQLVYSSTGQLVYSLTGKLTKHTTPLSPWRGAGGEALLPSFVEGLWVKPFIIFHPQSQLFNLNYFGMQVHAIGLPTIKRVAKDGQI